MILKQKKSIIGLTTKKQNLFVLNIYIPLNKTMLSKKKSRPIYLLSKNLQIKLWHQQLEYILNTKVIEALKLINGINIIIENKHQMQEKLFSFDFEDDNKNKILKQSPASNIFPTFITTLLKKITSTSINFYDFVKQLYNLCIKNKYTKIVRYIKMTPTTCKLKKIHVNL